MKDDDDAAEKRDAVRFKKYAVVFSRPAFQYSCITEGALYELEDALENVTGAIGTGSVYSRKSELMATDDPSSLFESASFKGELETIRESVLVLSEFVEAMRTLPGVSEGASFDAQNRLHTLLQTGAANAIVEVLTNMQRVDEFRNATLLCVNELLARSGSSLFPMIVTTRELILAPSPPTGMMYINPHYFLS